MELISRVGYTMARTPLGVLGVSFCACTGIKSSIYSEGHLAEYCECNKRRTFVHMSCALFIYFCHLHSLFSRLCTFSTGPRMVAKGERLSLYSDLER